MSDYSNLNAIVRTFLRDEHMRACCDSLERHYHGIQIVLVDDGYSTPEKRDYYAGLRSRGHIVEDTFLPFDSGCGAKWNVGAALCKRDYILFANDDYLFQGARDGINTMAGLFVMDPEIGVICGTYNDIDYQGWIKEIPGRIEETMCPRNGSLRYWLGVRYEEVDICACYGIMKREVFTSGVRWDARYKIGGEHGDWFMDVKRAGYKILFTPDAKINEGPGEPHPDYANYRNRSDWKKIYREKHGPIVYRYFNGEEEQF